MTETKPIRVMLVDDHAVVRSGLSAFLLGYDDLELVAEASGGRARHTPLPTGPPRCRPDGSDDAWHGRRYSYQLNP